MSMLGSLLMVLYDILKIALYLFKLLLINEFFEIDEFILFDESFCGVGF